MKRTFAQMLRLTIAAMKTEVQDKTNLKQQMFTKRTIMYVVASFPVFFGIYLALNPPNVDMFFATMYTLPALKFFIYIAVGSWALFFISAFIIVYTNNTFLYKIRKEISLMLTLCLIFFVIFVLKVNFIQEHVEARSIEVLGELGKISPKTFAQKEDGTFVGTASVENSKEGNFIEYTVQTKPFQASKYSFSYAVEVEYHFVDESTAKK